MNRSLPPDDLDATRLNPDDRDATRLTPATPAPAEHPTVMSLTPSPAGSEPMRSGSSPLTIGDRFGRYTIVRLLGIGGMGAVYQAWDAELDVVVALKVIKPEVMRDPAAEQEIERRFKRELLLARQVTHKNVVRIHDLGEIDGIKYITMTYVEGTDLSTLLKQIGRLPIEKTLKIIRSVVSGLVAAHAAGVVHRDLKPANIMIDKEGEAIIMDFGIARSTSGPADAVAAGRTGAVLTPARSAAARYTDATLLGTIVGTAEYMAPEQARGLPVDERADVYTTGLILYDLLTGKNRAESGGTAHERLRARLDRPLPPVGTVAPDVPEAVSAVVTRAIALDPDERFRTSAELAEALARLDARGLPIKVKRTLSLPIVAAVVTMVIAISAGIWWYTRPAAVDGPHDPVSVVIADIDNRTGDPTFDRTLEPMLRRALEGAAFITAYDRNGIKRTVGAALPETLDAAAAGEIAVKQGLSYVLTGSIEKQGAGFSIAMTTTQPRTGKVMADGKARASGPDQVIATATRLISGVRKALGDRTSESDQMFAMTSLSTSSLDVVRYYSAAMESSSNNRFDDAQQSLLKAVELDPKFGVGYLGLASVARNLGKSEDASKYINEALSHLDGMTERERYTTRGMFYRLTGDYQQCVNEHAELIKRYAADVIGHNQLALCASQMRNLARARDEMRAVVALLPKRAVFRDNLAIYSNYASDFDSGEQEARTVIEQVPTDANARQMLAFAELGRGLPQPAIDAFTELARTAPNAEGAVVPIYGALGPTFSASGLADVAVYEGRFADAVRIAGAGVNADLAAKTPARAAAKLAEQAYAQLLRGQTAAAIAAADKALSLSKDVKIRFLAARMYVEAGQPAKAKPLADGLSAEVQPEPQAYGKIVDALAAIKSKDARPAIKLLTDANALLDTWIGHFDLGRAYFATGQYPQADSEFDRCLKRKGEALALFLDEEPTFAYFPAVYYWQGRVREAMKLGGFADSYRAYLAIREAAGEDPLIADLKRTINK